jgi:hypothetical protein
MRTWWHRFPFVLDFLRDVHGKDISIFIFFNLSKPKSESKALLSFYQANEVKTFLSV